MNNLVDSIMSNIREGLGNLNEASWFRKAQTGDLDHTHNNYYAHMKQRLVGFLSNKYPRPQYRVTLIDKSARAFDPNKENVDIIVRNTITREPIGYKIVFRKNVTTTNFRLTSETYPKNPKSVIEDENVTNLIFVDSIYDKDEIGRNICVGYEIYSVTLTDAIKNELNAFPVKGDRSGSMGIIIPIKWIIDKTETYRSMAPDSNSYRQYMEIVD